MANATAALHCTGPTWSSTSSEGCVAAIEQACNKICSRLQPHLQQRSSTWETWQATVAEVQEGSGLSPASVMLSAYGFYDGTARDESGRTTKGGCCVSALQLCMQQHCLLSPSACTPSRLVLPCNTLQCCLVEVLLCVTMCY